MKWLIEDLQDLVRVAGEFIKFTSGHRIFALYGPMGVGKTTFVKAVAKCLECADEVNSPTFAIVNEYLLKNGSSIFHFDFYRLKDPTEALDFGCEEYFDSGNLCFMEWPEKLGEFLPEETVACEFSELQGGKRELVVKI